MKKAFSFPKISGNGSEALAREARAAEHHG